MKTRVALALVTFLFIAGSAQKLSAQASTNSDCLTCHSDSTLTMQSNGKNVSLFVSEKAFTASVHGDAGLSCVDCHQGFDANDVPHKQTTPNVNCTQCHDVQLHAPAGAKYQLAHSSVKCWGCHGTHAIQSADKISVVKKCLECHAREKTFLTSAHSSATIGHNQFTCETCHQKAHDARMTVSLQGVASDTLCSQCHKDVAKDISRGIHGKALAEGKLTCVSCHTAHSAETSKEAISQNSCYKCHSDKRLFDGVSAENGTPLTSLVQEYQHSIHAAALRKNGKGATCVDCHGSHTILPASDSLSPVNRNNIVSTCGKCHADVEKHYLNSSHGKAYKEGLSLAPVCTDCHKEHSIESISSPNSPVSRQNEPKICLDCHIGNPKVLKLVGVSSAFLQSIKYSVHLVALSKGNLKAATCSDCHGAHDMLPAGDPKSKVFRNNIPGTCGQAGCHQNVATKYFEGIHGQALSAGNNNAPVCTDCHGDHQILPPSNPQSSVSSGNIVQVCSNCHSSVRLTQRYGLPQHAVGSYLDSYHGLATQGGLTTVANCASCHGAHQILPSSDPKSPINKANLAATCGKCHPGADARFAATPVHVLPATRGEPLLFWISQIYIALIIVIIGGMFIHNLLDFVAKGKRRLRHRRKPEAGHRIVTERLYIRMTKAERLQHWGLLVSFILLVLTGFMLKFPDSWWVRLIREIGGGGEGVFELRSLIHRLSGVLLILTALVHLGYVIFTQRGRQFIKDMLPKMKDAADIMGAVKYYFGLQGDRPMFDRFSYIEKAEYWALIWGTLVMALTGLLMWSDNFTMNNFTKLALDTATLIHYYEAILASLAIIVWHMYFVIFNPDVYPMNLSWLVGTISEEEMLDEHPLELERLQAEEETAGRLVVENGDDETKGKDDGSQKEKHD